MQAQGLKVWVGVCEGGLAQVYGVGTGPLGRGEVDQGQVERAQSSRSVGRGERVGLRVKECVS